jgi:hypothetical protein
MVNMHILGACKAIFKFDGKKGGKKDRKRRKTGTEKVQEEHKSDGKKEVNMHLLKAGKARCKRNVKIDGKRNGKRLKKGRKKGEKGKKGRKERWAVCMY